VKRLLIYPTSRVLRKVSQELKDKGGFLPTIMRMDEFEKRATITPNRVMVDPLERVLYLQEATNFKRFETLKLDRSLVKFFTKGDAIFKFFEELAQEGVEIKTLAEADAYAEFDRDLEILQKVLDNYRDILHQKGMSDRAFLPKEYRLNLGFIDEYSYYEIYLEGYLSNYELKLLHQIGKRADVVIHYVTSKFNQKMVDRFQEYGVSLPLDSIVKFNFSQKYIIDQRVNISNIDAQLLQVEERYEQIAIAFAKIEEFVSIGIEPEKIVLVVPDESIVDTLLLYDRHHNLNFAMGFSYSKKAPYKRVEALYNYWQTYSKDSRFLLEKYGIDIETIMKIDASTKSSIKGLFQLLDELKLLDSIVIPSNNSIEYQKIGNEQIFEKQLNFIKLFEDVELSYKDWLSIWCREIAKITIDDVRGGKITVMGLLETRGIEFEGVVVVDFNDGIVPVSTSKDQFLNSSVRAFAKLPTQQDRESLQKQYYKRLFERASKIAIIYASSENRLPSKFLYELGIYDKDRVSPQLSLLYGESSQIIKLKDPTVEKFNALDIIWSASRLKVYLECKRKYYYRYIERLDAPKSDDINEGAILHIVLDHLFADKDHYSSLYDMQKDIKIVLERVVPHSDAQSSYHKLLWGEKLKGFVDAQIRHFDMGWRVVDRERNIEGEIGGLRFKGRIDRIDQNSSDTLVIDYKSGSIKEANRSKNLENLKDFQMSIYDHMLSSIYNNRTLAYLQIFEDGNFEEITKLEEKNELLLEHIYQLKKTDSFIATKCEELHRCNYCEFTLLCERGKYI